jgi:superfamily II DNA helicase RecQ
VADLLNDADVDADAYHAGRDEAKRKRVQSDWMAGELRVVVATIACACPLLGFM